jgi:hypothetical protein
VGGGGHVIKQAYPFPDESFSSIKVPALLVHDVFFYAKTGFFLYLFVRDEALMFGPMGSGSSLHI